MSKTETVLEKRSVGPPAYRMSVQETWKMSKLPYVELLYKSNQLASGATQATLSGLQAEESQKRIRSMLKNAKVSKVVFTIFICLGSAAPFVGFAMNRTPISLASAIAISLVIGFAYLVFYSLQILPSFSSAEPYSLLLTLPFSKQSYSLVTMFSFVRTIDYLAIGSIIIPFASVAALTGSITASGLMLGASGINVILAVAVGLWISRLFYQNITRGGRSKAATLSRIIFLITWGFAVMSTGFLFQIVTYLPPYANQIFSGGINQGYGVILSVLLPFTFGLATSSLAFPGSFISSAPGASTVLFAALSYVAAAAYLLVAILAVRRTSHILTGITHGKGVAITRETAREFTVKLRKPLSAYIMKDVRSASKNPSTAFLFALPLFETVIIFIALNQEGVVNILDVASMTVIGAMLTLMVGTMLLNTERKGIEYSLSLPLTGKLIIDAKSLIATLTYIPAPFAILLLQLLRSGVSISSLFPFIEIFAVSAATTVEVAVLISGHNGPRTSGALGTNPVTTRTSSRPLQSSGFSMISGSNLTQMIKAIAIGLVVMAAPIASYFVLLSATNSGSVSIIGMALVAVLELVIVQAVLRRQ